MFLKGHNLSEEEGHELLEIFPRELTISISNHSLPYEELDGLRFERLCYEILCSEGRNPRYNGNSGQRDYGIDIITEQKDKICVYQCKNIKDKNGPNETIKDIQKAYIKMQEHWVIERKLPTPQQFVYYSRQKLGEIEISEEYTNWRLSILQKDKIDVQLWGRETIDFKLRNNPSVVSGIFSNTIASTFCDEKSLPRDSQWELLQHNKSEDLALREFFSDWKNDKLYLNPSLKDWFTTAIFNSPVVLLQGYPGAGKTVTTLLLLTTLKHCPNRIYYSTIGNFDKLPDLIDSVKKRSHLPSIFILDDCHSNPRLAVDLIQKLRGSLLNTDHPVSIKFIILMRGTPKVLDNAYNRDFFQQQLELEEDCVKFLPLCQPKQLLPIIQKRLSDCSNINIKHAKHIFDLTGGNLKLVNMTINNITEAEDIFHLNVNSIKRNVQDLYVERMLGCDQSPVKNLSALAMFDITPLTNYIPVSEDILKKGWVTLLYSPKRARFFHSTFAEVLFYVLVDMEEGLPDDWTERINQDLIQYLNYLVDKQNSELSSFLLNLANSQLYFPEFNVFNIVSGFINTSVFQNILFSDIPVIKNSALRLFLFMESKGNQSALSVLNKAIFKQLEYLWNKSDSWSKDEFSEFKSGVFSLCRYSIEHPVFSGNQLIIEDLTIKIINTFYFIDLIKLLHISSPSIRIQILNTLNLIEIDEMINRTVNHQRSIGTLGLFLREFKKITVTINNRNMCLLGELEKKVTAQHFLDLIIQAGTIFEFFNLISNSSPLRSFDLIKALTEDNVNKLIQNTIYRQRSIGTLSLTLRDVKKNNLKIKGKNINLLTLLEQKILPQHILRLIFKRGSIFDFFYFSKVPQS